MPPSDDQFPVNDDLSRRALESLKRGQGTPSSADTNMSAPSTQPASARDRFFSPSSSSYTGGDTLNGGDGRVIQRNQNFPPVFLLHPRNLKYVRGESEKPTNVIGSGWVGVILIIVFLVFFFGFSGFGAGMVNQFSSISRFGLDVGSLLRSPIAFFLGIFGLVFVIGIAFSVNNARRLSRLAQQGTLLLGQAVAITGRWVTTGSGKNRSRSYKVTVAYRLRLPDGRLIDGQQTATRGDLARKMLDGIGTPVAVLYVSDDDKMLL